MIRSKKRKNRTHASKSHGTIGQEEAHPRDFPARVRAWSRIMRCKQEANGETWMRKGVFVALCVFALSACTPESGQNKSKPLNRGYIHFASLLALDDLLEKETASPFLPLSPVPIIPPDKAVPANDILSDFRKDFATAEQTYPKKVAEGIPVAWNVDYAADGQYETTYHQEDRSDKNVVFAGKLSVKFDAEFYSAVPYPTYPEGSRVMVICREYVKATEKKNDYLHWLEVSLDKCLAAGDYYSSAKRRLAAKQEQLKERLTAIYEGKEEIDPAMAKRLAILYKAGESLPGDSLCFRATREECFAKLKQDILKKADDAEPKDIETMKVTSPPSAETKRSEAPSNTPAGQAPAGQAPAGQASAGQASAGQASAGQASAGQASAGQASAGQASAGQASAGQASAGQAPAGQAPAGQASAGQASAGQASAGQAPAGQAPAGQAPAGQTPPPHPGPMPVTVPDKQS
jgi:hypothetical protein